MQKVLSPKAVQIGWVLLAIGAALFFLLRPNDAISFACKNDGFSKVLPGSVMIMSCGTPRFMVSCDERTAAFYGGAYHCASFDAETRYSFRGKFEQVK